MKKILSLVLVLMIVLSCVSALAEGRTKVPAGQIEGGPDVYFVIASAFFQDGSDIIVIGQKNNSYYKRYDQPVATQKVDDDYLLPLDALSKIFQFSYTYDAATGAIHLEDEYVKADLTVGSKEVTIDGIADTLGAAPAEVEGVLCVPAISVGTKVFALVTGESQGYTYLAYEPTELPKGSTGISGSVGRLTIPGKIYGVIEPVYWFEDAQMLMPYRLFVPTCYNPEVPNALVVFLHGSGGNDNRDVERTLDYNGSGGSGTWWDYALDQYGLLGLSVNGYALSYYGSRADSDDPVAARASELGELEVLAAIAQVKEKYNVDENRVFIMGNSMGCVGATWLACKYPEMFAAICACGGFTTKKDMTAVGDMPIRVVSGTEDPNYNTALSKYLDYKEKGLNITFRGVGGGFHNTAWSQGDILMETFEFFANVKK